MTSPKNGALVSRADDFEEGKRLSHQSRDQICTILSYSVHYSPSPIARTRSCALFSDAYASGTSSPLLQGELVNLSATCLTSRLDFIVSLHCALETATSRGRRSPRGSDCFLIDLFSS
ncbi:uncharacterized [Tachysurus ichikawai]